MSVVQTIVILEDFRFVLYGDTYGVKIVIASEQCRIGDVGPPAVVSSVDHRLRHHRANSFRSTVQENLCDYRFKVVTLVDQAGGLRPGFKRFDLKPRHPMCPAAQPMGPRPTGAAPAAASQVRGVPQYKYTPGVRNPHQHMAPQTQVPMQQVRRPL